MDLIESEIVSKECTINCILWRGRSSPLVYPILETLIGEISFNAMVFSSSPKICKPSLCHVCVYVSSNSQSEKQAHQRINVFLFFCSLPVWNSHLQVPRRLTLQKENITLLNLCMILISLLVILISVWLHHCLAWKWYSFWLTKGFKLSIHWHFHFIYELFGKRKYGLAKDE